MRDKQTIKYRYTLPRIDSLLHSLNRAESVPNLDLGPDNYWLGVEEESIGERSFRNNWGR